MAKAKKTIEFELNKIEETQKTLKAKYLTIQKKIFAKAVKNLDMSLLKLAHTVKCTPQQIYNWKNKDQKAPSQILIAIDRELLKADTKTK